MPEVTLFSMPGCGKCNASDRDLKKLADQGKIQYTYKDISTDAEAEAYLKSKGVQQMPYVETEEDSWTGYDRNKIKALA